MCSHYLHILYIAKHFVTPHACGNCAMGCSVSCHWCSLPTEANHLQVQCCQLSHRNILMPHTFGMWRLWRLCHSTGAYIHPSIRVRDHLWRSPVYLFKCAEWRNLVPESRLQFTAHVNQALDMAVPVLCNLIMRTDPWLLLNELRQHEPLGASHVVFSQLRSGGLAMIGDCSGKLIHKIGCDGHETLMVITTVP